MRLVPTAAQRIPRSGNDRPDPLCGGRSCMTTVTKRRDECSANRSRSRRVLVISCSERKRSVQGPLAAIDRYDGPAFRVVRRYLRETQDRALKVYILSA